MLVKGAFTQISGSFGGLTGSHNRGGQYLRARTIPTDPNTVRQANIRAIMTDMVQSFETNLSEAQRNAWRTYAANVTVAGPLGDAITLSAQNWYIGTNVPRIQGLDSGLTDAAGLARVDAAPTTFNTGEAVDAINSVTVALGVFDLEGNLAAPASAAGVSLLYVGLPQNESVAFYKGPYQLAAAAIFALNDQVVTFQATLNVATDWASDRVPAVGNNLPVRIVNLFADGRKSLAFRTLVTVA